MLERFKTMSPDEQQQFLSRMKERGGDTSAFEAAAKTPAKATPKRAGALAAPQAQTIDALFAPLPPVETRGRAWISVGGQLKPVTLRLGITDGTYTEVISGDGVDENTQVVTGVTGLAPTRALPQQQQGNPFTPGRGGPGGGRGGFGGRG
jgi:hypothetical protein